MSEGVQNVIRHIYQVPCDLVRSMKAQLISFIYVLAKDLSKSIALKLRKLIRLWYRRGY